MNAVSPDLARRVLVVDDSAVARAVIGRSLEAGGGFVVSGSVATARAALDFLSTHQVEFILLDIQLPDTDGLTALPDLIAAAGDARVLVVSSAAGDGAVATVQALALGAADTLVKPIPGEPVARFGEQLVEKLNRLADPAPLPALACSVPPRIAPARAAIVSAARLPHAYEIVAIGASTGGIHALSGLLRELPADFTLPVLITQHLPASFMPYFAAQLSVMAGRPCDVASDRMRLRPGRLTVAPGDAHVRCVRLADGRAAVRLSHEPAASGCLPSVDPMFASLAAAYGERVLAIVLSGMGRDGAEGARRVREAGGSVVVQDQATSVVWGMPGAVASLGLADAVLPPDAIGRFIAGRRRPPCP